jgi:hypothetical protein
MGILGMTVVITLFYVLVLDTVKIWFYKSSIGANL